MGMKLELGKGIGYQVEGGKTMGQKECRMDTKIPGRMADRRQEHGEGEGVEGIVGRGGDGSTPSHPFQYRVSIRTSTHFSATTPVFNSVSVQAPLDVLEPSHPPTQTRLPSRQTTRNYPTLPVPRLGRVSQFTDPQATVRSTTPTRPPPHLPRLALVSPLCRRRPHPNLPRGSTGTDKLACVLPWPTGAVEPPQGQ